MALIGVDTWPLIYKTFSRGSQSLFNFSDFNNMKINQWFSKISSQTFAAKYKKYSQTFLLTLKFDELVISEAKKHK